MSTTTASLDTEAVPALAGIHHVGLTVCDAEASAAWYERVFGFVRHFVEPHKDSDAGGYAIVIGTADHRFGIGLDHHPANGGDGFDCTRTGLDHLCFSVVTRGELEQWASRLDALAIPNSGIYGIEGMPVSLLTFTDPDGIQLELMVFGDHA